MSKPNVSFNVSQTSVDFEAQKEQHRQQLEERMRIQRRIEAMRREYDFISKLDTADVTYILNKKKEQAAILIQRNFRKLKARKELKERKAGLYQKLDEDEFNLPEDTGRVKLHRQELQQIKAYVNGQFVDNHHRRITEDGKRELLDEVIKRRRLVAESDLKQYNTTKIRLEYQDKFAEFEDQYAG